MTRLLSIAALALGCSATVAPVSTVDPDAAPPLATDAAPPLATDAAPPLATDAAPDTALPLATDAAMPLATDAATCLDDTAPRLEAGPDTAAGPALVVRAAGDRARNACADAWGMGGDARARFRAPRAGRWTFSAQGDQLWSFAARDLCARGSAERACTPYRDYHGGNPFSQPLVITVRLDAGEEVLLQADGCVGGCAWTLQATRQPDRGCFDPDRTCPMGARCTTPEGGVDAASVCVPGRPPTLGAVQVLRGAGTLRVIGEASDADRDIARVRVIATDLRGGPLPGAQPWWVYATDTTHEAVSCAQAEARAADQTAPAVQLVVIDALGLESEARVVPIVDAPARADGEACDVTGLRDVCPPEHGCTRAARCAPYAPPALTAVAAHRAREPEGAALALRWRDAHDDATTVEVTTLTDRGRTWSLSLTAPPEGVDWVTRWAGDVFDGAARVRVRLRDRTARWSEAVEVDVRPPAPAGEGEACDPLGITARCAAGLSCDRGGDPRCLR